VLVLAWEWGGERGSGWLVGMAVAPWLLGGLGRAWPGWRQAGWYRWGVEVGEMLYWGSVLGLAVGGEAGVQWGACAVGGRKGVGFRRTTAGQRKLLFEEWEATGNVTAACQVAHVGRGTFYHWKSRYQEEGSKGIEACASTAPVGRRGVGEWVERRVIALREEHPEWGKQRIADEMRRENGWEKVVSANTVRRILREAGLWEAEGAPPKRGKAAVRRAERPGQTLNVDLCLVPVEHEVEAKLPAVSCSSGRVVVERGPEEGGERTWPGRVFEEEKRPYEEVMRAYVAASQGGLGVCEGAAASPAVVEESPVVVEESPAVVEESPAVVEESPAVVEESPAVVEESPAVVEESPAVVEESPAVVEESPVVAVEAASRAERQALREEEAKVRAERRKVRERREVEDRVWQELRAERKQEQEAYQALGRGERRAQRAAQVAREEVWRKQRAQRRAALARRKEEDAAWRQRRQELRERLGAGPVVRSWIAVLVVVDNCSRQCLGLPWFASGSHVTAPEVVAALGECLPPELQFLITDRGIHFTGEALAKLARGEEFVHVVIARHRPQSNGIAERFVRTFKEWLGDKPWHGEKELGEWVEPFREEYNERPHQGLGGLSPNEFARRLGPPGPEAAVPGVQEVSD
jgi:transposase InsO family protein